MNGKLRILIGLGVAALLAPLPGQEDAEHHDADHRHHRHAQRRHQLENQGRQECHPEHPHGGATESFRDQGDGPDLVSGPAECTLFLTASKASGGEGDHVFCARTTDGGATFGYVAPVTPAVVAPGFAIMPSSVRLSPSTLVTAVRGRGEQGEFEAARCWIDVYRSQDNGQTWHYLSRPVPDTGRGGNPPAMIRLQDGLLCLCYGYRAPPYGVCACLSDDGGQTWGPPIVLRDDGGNHDLGYPRTVQRADGTIVTAYYFNDRPEGERYIAATLWKP